MEEVEEMEEVLILKQVLLGRWSRCSDRKSNDCFFRPLWKTIHNTFSLLHISFDYTAPFLFYIFLSTIKHLFFIFLTTQLLFRATWENYWIFFEPTKNWTETWEKLLDFFFEPTKNWTETCGHFSRLLWKTIVAAQFPSHPFTFINFSQTVVKKQQSIFSTSEPPWPKLKICEKVKILVKWKYWHQFLDWQQHHLLP